MVFAGLCCVNTVTSNVAQTRPDSTAGMTLMVYTVLMYNQLPKLAVRYNVKHEQRFSEN